MSKTPKNQTDDGNVIICDWGTSHLRASLVDAGGEVLGNYESEMGVKAIAAGGHQFSDELGKVLNQFGLGSDFPVRISGMAGSKNGWIETDYASTPTSAAEFAGNSIPLPGFKNARLYGGLKHLRSDGSVDVMRGEEIQIFGMLATHPDANLVCLPGTHSKWAKIEDGRITGFKTYMTGDLFHSLCENSIFRTQIASKEFDLEGFLHGCELARKGNDLNNLFTLRTDYVFSKISDQGFHSCLSGFLITNEIMAEGVSEAVHLCGSGPLTKLYALALERLSVKSLEVDSEKSTILGHLEMMKI